MIRFQNQMLIAHFVNLGIQIILAFVFSSIRGWYWYWVVPLLQLTLVPRIKKQSLVCIDDAGVSVGSRNVFAWNEIETLTKTKWSRFVLTMKDGRKKTLATFDWPVTRRDQFLALLEEKGFYRKT